MTPAKNLALDFCNTHVVNVRGSEIQDFIIKVQFDARAELVSVISVLQERIQALERIYCVDDSHDIAGRNDIANDIHNESENANLIKNYENVYKIGTELRAKNPCFNVFEFIKEQLIERGIIR